MCLLGSNSQRERRTEPVGQHTSSACVAQCIFHLKFSFVLKNNQSQYSSVFPHLSAQMDAVGSSSGDLQEHFSYPNLYGVGLSKCL